ncbi:hypothetical protein OQJ18_13965 [Fluoribacter dumoffii]|uniref:Uncharacterized protein n=1 Tax=Fluoribacter dumoffii TaxID=463 RepID=A0A377GEV2_9GAMM|nr:hypothetical protein [Fluoribacter dumoffii]KTC91173.1 hypothetical protein Ldum_2241 [Fluoribacter dumoffii NY 23]MCW8387659.1 hypothetical protein [Fluoribacter dumoffii]MCW8416796.1 hypothetical protein [Fluoribacter dumoffii]MCW8455364.1 hypothetical protein [Fluoribacter dumoffii]MCW8460558.1 hypothetical protein [Fluoribacter dumoffii]
MCIFKDITNVYCQKILDAYQTQVDEKTYTGKEAELIVKRNNFARDLIKTIKETEVTDDDYAAYFEKILAAIDATLKKVSKAVAEFNKENKTAFTTDLYETCFNFGLNSFINALSNLVQSSPPLIVNIKDKSLFSNKKDSPWFYYSAFILYEYILEREFDIATQKMTRDIFDAKKNIIFEHIKETAELYSHSNNEGDTHYQSVVKILLEGLKSKEKEVQKRENSGYFYCAFYKASEMIKGPNQLGEKISHLLEEFEKRTSGKKLTA